MAAEPVISPMPVCESCWLESHTKWEPESVDEKGKILMRLKGVDVPEKVNSGSVEVCVMCGNITVAGIFELKLIDEVYFIKELFQETFEVPLDTTEEDPN
jgi:hypothetical protein